MHRSFVLALVTSVALVAVAATRFDHDHAALERHRAAERVRLRAHFDSVDVELRGRDVASLTSAQRTSRARLIVWLRDYRDAGRFPENDRFAAPTPFFHDHRGVSCAMAYLIERSGRRDIVDDVARTRNNAYIAELVDDPRLVAWLDSVGLTAAEAARIQPQYGGGGCCTVVGGSTEPRVSHDYRVAAGTLDIASLATVAVNVLAPGRVSGSLGIVAGLGATTIGALGLAKGGNYRPLAGVSVGAGVIAAFAGAHALNESLERHGRRLSVAPALGAAGGRGPGVVVHARF